jgi:hypothetical protein
MPLPAGRGGSVLTPHQSCDMETDGQHSTRNGSSGQPSALPEMSYFTGMSKYVIFYNIILGLGKMTNNQDQFPATQESCSSSCIWLGKDARWLSNIKVLLLLFS